MIYSPLDFIVEVDRGDSTLSDLCFYRGGADYVFETYYKYDLSFSLFFSITSADFLFLILSISNNVLVVRDKNFYNYLHSFLSLPFCIDVSINIYACI